MKVRTWKVGIAVLALGVAPAAAETNATGWSYDNNVKSVAFSDCCEPECGCTDPCCSDPCCECGDGCKSGCIGAIEGFTLAGLIGLPADSQIEFGGWTEGFYTNDNVPLSTTFGDGASFDDVPDRFNLGQQWFYLGRTLSGDGFDVGGRVDLLYGTDASKTQAFGNPAGSWDFQNGWDRGGAYGWAMPQLYGEIGYGDLSVKIGHFYTLIGYEVVPVTGNFFRTHSYTMFNSEPFTHTGAVGTYAFGDALTLYGGWTAGWDTGFDQLNSGSSWLGGFAYALNDNVTFTYMSTYGNFGWLDGGSKNSYSHSLLLVADLTDRLQYIAQSDLVDTSNPGVSEYDTIGLNQYLLYWLNDVVGVGGRAEWWKADGLSFYEVTGGFNFKVLSNVNIRPEYRYDWSPGLGEDRDIFAVDAYMTY